MAANLKMNNMIQFTQSILFFILFISIYNIIICFGEISSGNSVPPSLSGEPIPPGIKIAYCLTGQLSRLELLSKLKHVILPNAVQNIPHLYVYLDSEVENVKQTYWNYNYTHQLYSHMKSKQLRTYIRDIIDRLSPQNSGKIKIFVILGPPSRSEYHVVNNKIPVKPKSFSGHDGPRTNYESAESRFQNNMRWMGGLRDCVRYVQDIEFRQQWHYDLIVRIRDDSYALGDWIIDSDYIGKLSSLKTGSFRGINDHNMVVDRKYADSLLRGMIEDYYFNSTLEHVFWGNVEHRILMIANAYNIPLRETDLCQQPLIPLRGLIDESSWRLHPLYVRQFNDDCQKVRNDENLMKKYKNQCCTTEIMKYIKDKAVNVNV